MLVSSRYDVVVIGAGHNGLVCGCYLARAGLRVAVVEAADEPGGCISTVDLPGGTGRLELGAYEHGGLRTSGVAADLDLETRCGLRFHLRDELVLAPCDDGTALAFHDSRERTVDGLRVTVGDGDADAYDRFARWAQAATGLLAGVEAGPPPSLRQLAALAETTLGAQAPRLLQALLGSASALLRGSFTDPRLQGVLAHWAAHSQQPPTDPGTGLGGLLLAGGHGTPAARPMGGSRATVAALVRCLRRPEGPCTAARRPAGSRCPAAGRWPCTPGANGSKPPRPSCPRWTPVGCSLACSMSAGRAGATARRATADPCRPRQRLGAEGRRRTHRPGDRARTGRIRAVVPALSRTRSPTSNAPSPRSGSVTCRSAHRS